MKTQNLKQKIKRPLFHIFLPLFIGSLAYLFFYPTETILSRFFETQLGLSFFENSRKSIPFPSFIVNHVLDGLWAYALTATLIIVLKEKFKTTFLAFIAFSFCTFYEYAQYQHWISGTFDGWDILVMGVFIFIALKNLKNH